MLTKSEWKTVKYSLNMLTKTCCIPFDWHEDRQVLLPCKSKLKVVASAICALTTFSYALCVFARVPSTYRNEAASKGDWVMHILCVGWYFTMALWEYTIGFQCRHEVCEVFNQQVYLNYSEGTTSLTI